MRRFEYGAFIGDALLRGISIVAAVTLPLIANTSISAQQPRTGVTPPADMLLLYSANETYAGAGFEKAVALYGLGLAKVDISTTPVTDGLLKDGTGAYYLGVFIDGMQVDDIDQNGTQALRNAINTGGVNLFVSNFRDGSSTAINTLTDGEITGSIPFAASSKNYTVTTTAPEVTRQLSGVNVRHATTPKDAQLGINQSAQHTQVLAYEAEDSGNQDPLFARFKNGTGSVFVVSNYTDSYLSTNLLTENYYVQRSDGGYFTQQWFSQITPLLMFVRYAGGQRAWHTNHNYANFTLDDPLLQQSAFDYAGMLQQTQSHHFHFTLAAVPALIDQREQSVVDIFAHNPDYMSIVQHGNHHDGYEFYSYAVTATNTDTYTGPYPARPFTQQVANIQQGKASMQAFSQQTSVPYGQVMVFPYNISPSPTLTVLKEYNFLATINSSDTPLDTPRTRNWDAYMYPAEMAYNNFPVMVRYGTSQSPYPFLFFLGKPVVEYDHISRFAPDQGGIGAYDEYADDINSVYGGNVEWKSLDFILKHMYFERANRDGSMGVMFWTNNVMITNDTKTQHVYHLQKEETLNVPIESVTVNGVATHYDVIDNQMKIDIPVAPGETRNVMITYSGARTRLAIPDSPIYVPVIIREN